MLFSDKKCEFIVFGSQNYRTAYKLGETVIDWADTIYYLGVIMQSNLKFEQRMALKKDKASKLKSNISPTKRLVTGLH